VKGEIVDEHALKLVTACKSPDILPELVVFEEPRYKLPAPRKVTPFYFRPDEVTAGLMLPALMTGGVQRSGPFQAVVETPPPPPDSRPRPPRRGVGMICRRAVQRPAADWRMACRRARWHDGDHPPAGKVSVRPSIR
jgi:hypothetical protein